MTWATLHSSLTVGLSTWLLLAKLSGRRRGQAAMVATLVLAVPVLGLGLIGFLLIHWWLGSRRRQRLDAAQAQQELELLARSLLVALSGGLSQSAALASTRRLLRSRLGEEIDRILRASVSSGLGSALMAATGQGGRLFRQLGAAHISGTPMIMTLTALANDLHESARAEAFERARKLPVKMTVPLSLLMLPGLLLLLVGPTLAPAFEQLLTSLAGA